MLIVTDLSRRHGGVPQPGLVQRRAFLVVLGALQCRREVAGRSRSNGVCFMSISLWEEQEEEEEPKEAASERNSGLNSTSTSSAAEEDCKREEDSRI